MQYFFVGLTLVILLSSGQLKAQERAKIQFQEYSTGPGSFFQEIPVAKQPMGGQIYTRDAFFPGNIVLTDQTEILDVPLRYNAFIQSIEVEKNGKIFEISDDRISDFSWKDKPSNRFINSTGIPVEERKGLDGFLEVVYESPNIVLYKRYEVEILKANYNLALNTGNKNDTAILKNHYYIHYQNQLHPFEGKKKELPSIFGDNARSIATYIKQEKLKFKKEEDYKILGSFIQQNF